MSEGQRGGSYVAKRKKDYFRVNDYRRRRIEECLEAGIKGFICTCNFFEDQCKREAYNILNEYSEPEEIMKPTVAQETAEEDDIEESLNREVSELKAQTSRGSKDMKFKNVRTGAKNCLFIRTTVPDPVHLAVRILEDIETSRKQKSRYLLRLLPVEITCKAYMNNMEEAFKPLAKKHFSSGDKTFSIMYRARNNNSIYRDEVIELLAGLIKAAHPLNRADLNNPHLTVLVEIIRGICCIGVVPRYNELRKYNLHELTRPVASKGEGDATKAGEGEGGEDDPGVEASANQDEEEAAGGGGAGDKAEATDGDDKVGAKENEEAGSASGPDKTDVKADGGGGGEDDPGVEASTNQDEAAAEGGAGDKARAIDGDDKAGDKEDTEATQRQ